MTINTQLSLAFSVSLTSYLQTIDFVYAELTSYLETKVLCLQKSPNALTSSLISFVLAKSKSWFATLSQEDLNLLLDDKDAKSTKRAIKSALKVFHQYLKEKKADEPQKKDTLATVLRLFYAEARKADGTPYSKSTLNSLRFSLNWLFKATPGFDIINDSEFTHANKVLGPEATRAGKS